jgi:hypothetical protein
MERAIYTAWMKYVLPLLRPWAEGCIWPVYTDYYQSGHFVDYYRGHTEAYHTDHYIGYYRGNAESYQSLLYVGYYRGHMEGYESSHCWLLGTIWTAIILIIIQTIVRSMQMATCLLIYSLL